MENIIIVPPSHLNSSPFDTSWKRPTGATFLLLVCPHHSPGLGGAKFELPVMGATISCYATVHSGCTRSASKLGGGTKENFRGGREKMHAERAKFAYYFCHFYAEIIKFVLILTHL